MKEIKISLAFDLLNSLATQIFDVSFAVGDETAVLVL